MRRADAFHVNNRRHADRFCGGFGVTCGRSLVWNGSNKSRLPGPSWFADLNFGCQVDHNQTHKKCKSSHGQKVSIATKFGSRTRDERMWLNSKKLVFVVAFVPSVVPKIWWLTETHKILNSQLHKDLNQTFYLWSKCKSWGDALWRPTLVQLDRCKNTRSWCSNFPNSNAASKFCSRGDSTAHSSLRRTQTPAQLNQIFTSNFKNTFSNMQRRLNITLLRFNISSPVLNC